ncbi:MAG TPA: 16S rRNA (cytosine(967)-C(5))-methyltransferase RsmB [Syntrophales bacterium]|nr:16S rRNA (cytosine(967)-C(5))-methyltransferase RsmB [Syntrophales bacterium]
MDRPRSKALEILRKAEAGVFADSLLDEARRSFDERDRAFLLELVYGVLRNRLRLDWALDRFSAQPVQQTDASTRNILRLGAYQLLFLDRVPPSAAVNTSVELAKAQAGKQGYVNGLLRNLDRKRNSIFFPGAEDPVKRLSVLYSHPSWLVARWIGRFGAETAETILRANNAHAPLVLRVNRLRTTREELRSDLEGAGVRAIETVYSPAGIRIDSPPAIRTLPGYGEGRFLVQDEAAQLVGMMLSPRPGERVLDACAAPGGKATHLAELMEDRGELVALDLDPERIARIRENSRRLGMTIIVPKQGDAASYKEEGFDRILIDAPCSGLGVLRRHPDGRWNKAEGTVRERAALQRRILENCARLLLGGGTLVYATCSTETEENEEVVDAFLSGPGRGFVVDDPRPYLPDRASELVDGRGFLHTYPKAPEMDGFFGARMVKKK